MKTMPLVTKIRGMVLGIAALVVAIPSVTTAQRVEYYHLDALGSVRAITDSSGDVITRHDYLPYGEEWNAQPSSDTRRFTGKERDSENGLDYFGARYYGTSTAMFTSVDPAMTVDANLVDPQRWNRYAYARASPLRYVDPTGMIINLAGLSTAQRNDLVADLNAFTGNTYSVDPNGNLVLASTGQNASQNGHCVPKSNDVLDDAIQCKRGQPAGRQAC